MNPIDPIAQRRIVELEAELHSANYRCAELARHVDLLNAENNSLREELVTMRSEATTLRLKLSGRVPNEEEA